MQIDPLTATAQERVAAHPRWYHTIQITPDLATQGSFDHRGIVDEMPWPDVTGKRCLDIGTFDGFMAFELERRGAAEVIGTDVPEAAARDFPADQRATAVERASVAPGNTKGAGFRLAAELLGSKAKRVEINIYDLSPERIGTFDVVVMGDLLLHLRDPIGALEAVRSVCTGFFLSSEQIDAALQATIRRRPVALIKAVGAQPQFFVPNRAGHERLVQAGGFTIARRSKIFSIPLGAAPAPRGTGIRGRKALLARIIGRGAGIPHSAVLATPIAR